MSSSPSSDDYLLEMIKLDVSYFKSLLSMCNSCCNFFYFLNNLSRNYLLVPRAKRHPREGRERSTKRNSMLVLKPQCFIA